MLCGPHNTGRFTRQVNMWPQLTTYITSLLEVFTELYMGDKQEEMVLLRAEIVDYFLYLIVL